MLTHDRVMLHLRNSSSNDMPTYLSHREGQDHQPTFVSVVLVSGQLFLGQSKASKKLAEQSAAEDAGRKLNMFA